MNEQIKYGDRVMCVTFPGQPRGFVIKQYYPTACPQQTQIICDDGSIGKGTTYEIVFARRVGTDVIFLNI